ncbi:MAG: class I SAM-dependent methyltransferase, partial [Nitriliruptorales bacterium]|nr:class I SAM-dependent methyltransferase [Nitriliruptorales bacterium]
MREHGGMMDATRVDSSEVERRWNQRFLDEGLHPWGREPNTTVAEIVAPLTPGDVLDLGAGEGRNAHWLADRGWRVTAVDISSVALETLREDSWGEGWDLTTIHADLRGWRPPQEQFDLVLLSFVHLEQPHRGELHRAAAAALRPGGTLVLVAHDRSNIEQGVG